MNFGFIGSESDWQFIQPTFQSPTTDRLLVVLIDTDESLEIPARRRDQSFHYFPSTARRVRDFDELSADKQVQAVILGGPFAERANRLRHLVQLGKHCICLHPADSNPLFYHEIALMASDRGVTLVPWLPARLHPVFQALKQACRSASFGAVTFVTIERSGAMPAKRLLTQSSHLAPRAAFVERLLIAGSYAEAVDVLAYLGHEITEVSCTGDLQVGRIVVYHRLSAGAASEIRIQTTDVILDYWSISVTGEFGSATAMLERGLAGGGTVSQIDRVGTRETEYAAPPLASLVMADFSKAASAQPHTLQWSLATRAVELADWAWYSLERRRAVDVFHEERGELASFKGRMTSLGCGLIWITLVVLIIVAAGKGLHLPGMDWLAVLTAIIWVLFIVFQALRWALPAGGERDQSGQT